MRSRERCAAAPCLTGETPEAAVRVGVYNRWLRTAGGGERYSLALADLIARQAEVDVLAPEAVDLHAIGDRLNLHLNGLRLRRVDGDESAVARASADYDLFVNATFLGLLRSRAHQEPHPRDR